MSSNITLATAAERFREHLESLGKKPSTIGTSGRVLERLTEFFGTDKEVKKIRPTDVGRFFRSDHVLKNGEKPRAKPSIDQHRRITRQFLIWCHEKGWVDALPVPKDEAELGGVRPTKSAAA